MKNTNIAHRRVWDHKKHRKLRFYSPHHRSKKTSTLQHRKSPCPPLPGLIICMFIKNRCRRSYHTVIVVQLVIFVIWTSNFKPSACLYTTLFSDSYWPIGSLLASHAIYSGLTWTVSTLTLVKPLLISGKGKIQAYWTSTVLFFIFSNS